MRTLHAGLALGLLWASGGCGGAGGGDVDLTVSQAMNQSPAFTTFNAGDGTGISDDNLVVTFSASDQSGKTLTMEVQGPLRAGQSVNLAEAHNFLSFNVNSSDGWSSNGGTLEVDGLSPYRVRLIAVPMLPGSGAVTGSFVLDGSGTFK